MDISIIDVDLLIGAEVMDISVSLIFIYQWRDGDNRVIDLNLF